MWFRRLRAWARRTGINMRGARSRASLHGTTAAHFARAALEGIAFQVADVLDVMQTDSNIVLHELRVDGGASANNLLMQFQADILGVPVVGPRILETTALGAAYLAGLAVGFWKDRTEIHKTWQLERDFEPKMSRDEAPIDARGGPRRSIARAIGKNRRTQLRYDSVSRECVLKISPTKTSIRECVECGGNRRATPL